MCSMCQNNRIPSTGRLVTIQMERDVMSRHGVALCSIVYVVLTVVRAPTIVAGGALDRTTEITCYAQMTQIAGAKGQAEVAFKLGPPSLFAADRVTSIRPEQISNYLHKSRIPQCPAGGRYDLGFPGEDTICSVHGAHDWLSSPIKQSAFKGDVPALVAALDDTYGRNRRMLSSRSLGWSALHCGALAGRDDVVRMLIDRGADVNHMTQWGQTPLDLATNTNVIRTLCQHGGREVYNVYHKKRKDVDRANGMIIVTVSKRTLGPNAARFAFGVSNKTDRAMDVTILGSIVCDNSLGTMNTAIMACPHNDNWLAPPDTKITLMSAAVHRFDMLLDYEVEEEGDSVDVHTRANGFWRDAGSRGQTSSDARSQISKLSIGAWVLADVKTESEIITGIPLHSTVVYVTDR